MNNHYAAQVVWSVEDDAFIAMAAEIPGCMADGKTQEEALTNLGIVIQEWIDVATEEGREIPKPWNVEDFARMQHESQKELQKHIAQEVNKAVQAVIAKLVNAQPQPPAWSYRGTLAIDPAENLVPSGGHKR